MLAGIFKFNSQRSCHVRKSNLTNTNWFKAEHKITGSILQGRYKSMLVEEDSYGIVLSAYIHLNPLKSGVVENLGEYKWSSYLNYVKDNKLAVDSLNTEFILNQFNKDKKKARRLYKKYLKENTNIKDPYKESFKSIVLGSKEYIEDIVKKIGKLGKVREIPLTKRGNTVTPDRILKTIERKYEIRKKEIIEKKKGNLYRKLSMYLMKKHTDLRLKQIGGIYKMDYTAISQSCNRFERELSGNRKLKKMLKEIEDSL